MAEPQETDERSEDQGDQGGENERNVVSDTHNISDTSPGEHARALRDQWSPSRANEALESAMEDKPLLAHLLDLRIVLQAAAIAIVVALLLWLIIGPATAGFALLVLYFGGWYVLARRSYAKRRETRPVDSTRTSEAEEDDDDDVEGKGEGGKDPDTTPFTVKQEQSGGG